MWTPQAVIEIIGVITTSVLSIFAAWKAMQAHATAQAAQKTADTNTEHGAVLSDRVHEMALSAPTVPAPAITAQLDSIAKKIDVIASVATSVTGK